GLGGGDARRAIVARESLVVRVDQVVTFSPRNRGDVVFPAIGEQGAGAFLVEPIDLPLAEQEDAAKYQLAHALRMSFRVREGERRAPRAAEDEPALDVEELAQPLHVLDEVPRRVVDERCMRAAPPAATLIEKHYTIAFRIEEASRARIAAGSGSAVHEDRGLAFRVAVFFVVDLVLGRHPKHPARVRLADRIERSG